MAKFVEAQIDGLAGRPQVINVKFHSDLNVFWGLNGSGKTSFLKILHSALTGEVSGIVRVPFKSARVSFEDGSGSGKIYTRSIRKTARISDLGREERELLEVLEQEGASEAERERVFLDVAGKLQWKTVPEVPRASSRHFFHGYLPISRMTDLARRNPYATRREPTGLLNEAIIDEEFARQTAALWRDYSNTALTRIRQAQEEGLADVLSAILTGERGRSRAKAAIPSDVAFELVTSFFRGQRIAPQLTSFEKFAENYDRNRLLQDVVERISDIQASIREAQEPERRLVEMFDNLFPANKQLILDSRVGVGFRIGGERVPLESLSSGEKQIVRLLLECLAARSHAILIDEPELSLHVDWQHRLVSYMRLVNPEAQLILATHSPEVMADVPVDKVFEL